jgi:hypothetical protein
VAISEATFLPSLSRLNEGDSGASVTPARDDAESETDTGAIQDFTVRTL